MALDCGPERHAISIARAGESRHVCAGFVFAAAQRFRVILALTTAVLAAGVAQCTDLSELKVVYAGDNPSRAAEFKSFLGTNVAGVETVKLHPFDASRVKDFDVVLIDWPQGGGEEFLPKESPLGELKNWTKPTVLLGSAGLHVATLWDVKGGFG